MHSLLVSGIRNTATNVAKPSSQAITTQLVHIVMAKGINSPNHRKIVSGCHMEKDEPRNLLVWDKHALTFRRKPTYKEAGM